MEIAFRAPALRAVYALTLLTACSSATQDLGETPIVYPIVTHAIADVKAKDITLGLRHGCLVTTDGAVKCWGSNLWTQLGNGTVDDPLKDGMVSDVVGLGSGIKSVAAGAAHTCAVSLSGRVQCWGLSGSGQLGNASVADDRESPIPVDATGLSTGVSAIFVRGDASCAVKDDTTLACWGDLMQNGKAFSGTVPVDIPFAAGVSSLDFIYTRAIATLSAVGTVSIVDVSQAYNAEGPEKPIVVAELATGVRAISSPCLLTKDGGVKCWAYPENDFPASQDFASAIAAAVDVPTLRSGVADLKCDVGHCCVITDGGGVKCWGTISWGSRLGEAFTLDASTDIPYDVRGLETGITALAVEDGTTCAVRSSGGVACVSYCTRDSCALSDDQIRLAVPGDPNYCPNCSL